MLKLLKELVSGGERLVSLADTGHAEDDEFLEPMVGHKVEKGREFLKKGHVVEVDEVGLWLSCKGQNKVRYQPDTPASYN